MSEPPSASHLSEQVVAFASRRQWERFHDPKNLAMALATEAGELLAPLRWVRNEDSDTLARTEPTRTHLLDEMGDVAILLLLLCDRV